MDQTGVDVVAGDLRDGPDLGAAHDDGVALDMAEALVVAADPGIEHLGGAALSDRAGYDLGFCVKTAQKNIHFAHSALIPVGQEVFADDDLTARAPALGPGIALGIVHAPDLAGLQRDRRALLQVQDGLGVEDALAAAFALAVVLFDIFDPGVFAHIKGVDAVVLAVAAAAVVDAAAGDDGHVRALAHIKIVIDHVPEAALGQHHRNMDRFVLRARRDADVDAVLVGLGLDDDMLRVAAEGLFAVGADIHCALSRALHVGDDGEDLLLDLVQHFRSTSSRLQPTTVSAMILG